MYGLYVSYECALVDLVEVGAECIVEKRTARRFNRVKGV